MTAPSSSPVRIARVIARMNVGGPARLVVWLTEALSGGEFESTLICGTVPAGEEDMRDFARQRGIEPVVFREMSREISPADVVTFWKLFRFFRRYRPGIVETHTAKAGAVGRSAAVLYRLLTRRRCHIVHFFHGHVFHGYYGKAKSAAFVAIEKMLARASTLIIVPSQQQLDEITGRYGVGKRAQFRVVPYGLDFDDFIGTSEHRRRLRSRLKIAEDETVVGIVGRLTAIKNQEMFLRVAARARDLALSRVRFVLFGIGGDRAMLEERARAMNLDNVLFAGFTEDAKEIYGAIDIVALTSRNEGMPLTLIEGMANGKPVVSSAVGGVVDLLGSVERREEPFEVRERGLTVASDDDAAFTAALVRLLDNAGLRRTLAERGRDHVLQTHGKQRYTETIRELYRQLR